MITGSIVSPSWSFSSRRHLFKNKDSNYSEHLPNNLRHNTYIEPFFSFPKYPLFCDIVNECNYKSISLICFDGISFFFYLFVCLPLLTQSRHNSHLLYLLPYHFYHQSINIILWLNMLYQKKKSK